MSEWRQRVREEIRRQVARSGSPLVTRQAILEGAQAWFSDVSSGKTPEQTLSRVLQELRDLGELEFVARGTYSALVETEGETALREEVLAPKVRSGARRFRLGRIAGRPFQPSFRSYVLPNFGHACAVCGLTPEWFLEAAHLRPVTMREDLAGDPSAGVALCKNHHMALEHGALVIEADLTLRVARRDIPVTSPELERVLLQYDGRPLRAPRHFDLHPDALPSIGARVA